jgi:hypothetical protein
MIEQPGIKATIWRGECHGNPAKNGGADPKCRGVREQLG